MAVKKSTSTPVSKETPQNKLLTETKTELERFSRMMDGLNNFCRNVDPGNQAVYEFSAAVSCLADIIQADASRIAEQIGKEIGK